MKITLTSFFEALGMLLCMIGRHHYSIWKRQPGSLRYWFRTCGRCNDLETRYLPDKRWRY